METMPKPEKIPFSSLPHPGFTVHERPRRARQLHALSRRHTQRPAHDCTTKTQVPYAYTAAAVNISILPPTMPSATPLKTGSSLFLGIELGVDQLRASIVDESLELVGVECVDFDSDLPEYQTQGGIFTTPGEAYTTPVEMWLKGLDTLFEKVHRNYELGKIKAIGGAAQHALVWWKSTPVPSFASLDPHVPLHKHFPAQTFAMPNTPVAQDTSAQPHAQAIEALLGGPDHMAARVGICANPSMVTAQLLRVRETWLQEVWARTGRVQLASAFIASLIAGKWTGMGEAEACATGAWVHGANANAASTPGAQTQGYWDEGVLDIVGGSREDGRRVRGWLGDVDASGGSRKAGTISRYLAERYGFDPDTIVAPFTTDYLASYLSILPSIGDAVFSFGPIDALLAPAQHYVPTRLFNLLPHPAQDLNEKRKYVAVLTSRNADVPRALVRDMYTKSWSAFDRLVAIVPPGGSIGLDDKLFSFWHLQPDNYPYSRVKGIFRFETGIKVNEFRDLRANPRCLLESQLLSFRIKWSRLVSTGVLGAQRKPGVGLPNAISPTPPPSLTPSQGRTSSVLSSLGLPFDPYDHTPLPTRVLATGAAANFPSVANLVGDIFNAAVYVPTTQIDSAQIVPHRNAPAQGFPSRVALGGAYLARWVWSREAGVGALGGFEDEMRRLLGKRWVATGAQPLRTHVGGALPLSASTQAANAPGSGANSGTSTPFGHPGARSALGNTVFVEEDEDEEMERERRALALGAYGVTGVGSPGIIGGGIYGAGATYGELLGAVRGRTQTGSTAESIMSGSSSIPPSSAFTTPDLGLGAFGMNSSGLSASAVTGPMNSNGGSGGAGTPTTPTPLTPVVALATGDAESQIGLAKVAEPDLDAFMTYAAIVPEYSRLETMVVKGIV